MRPYLIQMGVWCASAIDVQPSERKTGCAWTDDRESSDAPTRQRFRTPLDKGSVNGCRLSGKFNPADCLFMTAGIASNEYFRPFNDRTCAPKRSVRIESAEIHRRSYGSGSSTPDTECRRPFKAN